MRLISLILIGVLRGLFRSRDSLMMENLALRHQLAALMQKGSRPRLTSADRVFWIVLRQAWIKWADALIVVKPETVVRWHRAGFRRYWRWKSKNPGRPKISNEVRDLIRRMAFENVTWGAPRIHAELLKLGFDLSERTVSRYMPKRPSQPDALKRWMTFLRNHREAIAAMDFFTVPTVTFVNLYVLFVISHEKRLIVHLNVSRNPGSLWVGQQIREAFPYDTAPTYLIFDRDSKFGEPVLSVIKNMGIKPVRIAYRSPWQNGVAEKWVASCRSELLNHVVIFGERHLRRLLKKYVDYYNVDRCHLSLDKDTPEGRAVIRKSASNAQVVSLPRLGGLHHRYEWREAA